MANAFNLNSVTKRIGATTLFSDLSFNIIEESRVGIIGANGSGKSTLLKMLAGLETPDSGSIQTDSSKQLSYIQQQCDFGTAKSSNSGTTVQEILENSTTDLLSYTDSAFQKNISILSSHFSTPPMQSPVDVLSGGELKRLQLVSALCVQPNIILMDEPTNHLDILARESLEKWIVDSSDTWLIVSHDRWLLHSVCDHIIEIDPQFPGGVLLVEGNYQTYLKRREELLAELRSEHQRKSTQARRELAWLRQGAKARSTKSKHRKENAYKLLESLKQVRAKKTSDLNFSFETSGRRSKELVKIENLGFGYGDELLIDDFTYSIRRGSALGILGANGSGKSTLLSLIQGTLKPKSGKLQTIPKLRVGVFAQTDPHAQSPDSLKVFFAPDGDSVVFADESIHVASWAQRFGFSHAQLGQPLSSLSGGERARARLAKLLLEPADLLLLDEPTNDLDIGVLEVLEESLLSFPGAVVLISHDRYFLGRVCSQFVGVEDRAQWGLFADLQQWLNSATGTFPESKTISESTKKKSSKDSAKRKPKSKKLSYNEQREYDSIENSIKTAEENVAALQAQLNDLCAGDPLLQELCTKLACAQQEVEDLYNRWQELEEKCSQ